MGKYKALLVNIGLFAINTVATKLITFLLVPLYTSYLTRSEFGIKDTSAQVTTMVTPLLTLAIAESALRYVIDDKKRSAEYISIGFYVTLFSCFIVAAGLPLLDLKAFGGLGDFKLLFLLAYASNAFFYFLSDITRGLDHVKLMVRASIQCTLTISALSAFFLVFCHMGLRGYFYGYIIGNTTAALELLFGKRQYKYILLRGFRPSKKLFKTMISYSIPLIPNWWLGISLSRLVINYKLGADALGLYAAVFQIPNIMYFVYRIFIQAWQLTAFQEFRKKNVSEFFSVMFKFLNAGLVVAAGLLITFTNFLSSLLLKNEFYSGHILLPLLLIAFYFSCLNEFFGTVFTSALKTTQNLVSAIIGIALCFVLTFALADSCGLFGACYATIAGAFCVAIIRYTLSKKYIRIKIDAFSTILQFALLAVQAAVITREIPYSIAISLAITFISAGLQIFAMRGELKKIKAMISSRKGSKNG